MAAFTAQLARYFIARVLHDRRERWGWLYFSAQETEAQRNKVAGPGDRAGKWRVADTG